MKKLAIISGIIGIVVLVSCSDIKREPGRVYMPDMAYSRAYETYAPRDSNFTTDHSTWESNGHTKIFYNNLPVAGTVSRSETYVFNIAKDKLGDSTNYVASKKIVNPFPALDSVQKLEAERLYLINCGICHGPKLDGNGPLYKDGLGPYPAKPAVLSGADATIKARTDGEYFYTITYGKNLMGSYAGQVTPKQRWAIIHYIRSVQGGGDKAAPTPAASTATKTTPSADSTAKK